MLKLNLELNNPGQFFACCGMHMLVDSFENKPVPSWFKVSRVKTKGSFFIETDLVGDDILKKFLSSTITVDKNFEDKKIAPLSFNGSFQRFEIDWWLNGNAPSGLKTWAGRVTPGAMLSKIQKSARKLKYSKFEDIFSGHSPETGRMGIDPRTSRPNSSRGFSASSFKAVETYSFVELLGTLGLQAFRPNYNQITDSFEYCIWRNPLLLRTAMAISRFGVMVPNADRMHFQQDKRGRYSPFALGTPV
jgi:hypothetical protein